MALNDFGSASKVEKRFLQLLGRQSEVACFNPAIQVFFAEIELRRARVSKNVCLPLIYY